jgi:hypothetical protein
MKHHAIPSQVDGTTQLHLIVDGSAYGVGTRKRQTWGRGTRQSPAVTQITVATQPDRRERLAVIRCIDNRSAKERVSG